MIAAKHIQTEVDASFLYGVLANHESVPEISEIFSEMSDIELSHAQAFVEKNK
jgi:hypothetical protein